MSPLICDRCGLEILPGSKVEFITPTPILVDARIIADDSALVVHATCPPEASP